MEKLRSGTLPGKSLPKVCLVIETIMERKKLALPTTKARSVVIKPRSSPVKEYTDIVLVNKKCGILSELLGDCVRRNSGLLAGLTSPVLQGYAGSKELS